MIISGFGDPELRAKRARLGLAGTQTQIGTDRPGLRGSGPGLRW